MLNPTPLWQDWFIPGESPYFPMFRAGCNGIPIDEVTDYCQRAGIPIRFKDVRAWQDGNWKHEIKHESSVINPKLRKLANSRVAATSKLEDFESWPEGWSGTSRRFFPTNEHNIPIQKWGYSEDYIPNLYDKADAAAMSPVGWVGQNIYAQPFIVFDIDGMGHGKRDEEVIAFGKLFKDLTECWEDPLKLGSFHLYFNTDKKIPIAHYNFAKLDILGNETNAAGYFKNKQSNGRERLDLTDEIWEMMKAYVQARRNNN